LGITINFDGELNKDKSEWKGAAVASLGIENYGDPFKDVGEKCKEALEKGDTESSIRHNRLFVERKRHFTEKRLQNARRPNSIQ
jgi:hypothetical protein